MLHNHSLFDKDFPLREITRYAPESPVVDRWNDYMKDILELEMDPVTGAQPKLEQVFRLD